MAIWRSLMFWRPSPFLKVWSCILGQIDILNASSPAVFIKLTLNITYMTNTVMGIWVMLAMWIGHVFFSDRHYEF